METDRRKNRRVNDGRDKHTVLSGIIHFYNMTTSSKKLKMNTERATDPFEGQTKLLLSEKPVYKCFVIHLHLKKKITFSLLYIH